MGARGAPGGSEMIRMVAGSILALLAAIMLTGCSCTKLFATDTRTVTTWDQCRDEIADAAVKTAIDAAMGAAK